MKNKKITWKITQGMYVLTAGDGGCVVDAVSQISGDENPLISVAVMKKNRTNQLMKENERFALSVLPKDGCDPDIIKTFGFTSSRDTDKFANIPATEVAGAKTLNDCLGYMVCEKVHEMDNTTHTLFLGRLVEGDVLNDAEPMSYGYYQAHKDELLKIKTTDGKTAWICTVCGYIYYGDEVPDDYECPICGVDKSYFKKQ